MSTENLILEHLRAIRRAGEQMSNDMDEIKKRIGNLENQSANMSNSLDRIEARVLRIEKRLDLVET